MYDVVSSLEEGLVKVESWALVACLLAMLGLSGYDILYRNALIPLQIELQTSGPAPAAAPSEPKAGTSERDDGPDSDEADESSTRESARSSGGFQGGFGGGSSGSSGGEGNSTDDGSSGFQGGFGSGGDDASGSSDESGDDEQTSSGFEGGFGGSKGAAEKSSEGGTDGDPDESDEPDGDTSNKETNEGFAGGGSGGTSGSDGAETSGDDEESDDDGFRGGFGGSSGRAGATEAGRRPPESSTESDDDQGGRAGGFGGGFGSESESPSRESPDETDEAGATPSASASTDDASISSARSATGGPPPEGSWAARGVDVIEALEIGWIGIFVRQMVLIVGFLGALVATRRREHITIDVLSQIASRRMRRAADTVTSAFAAIVCVVLALAGARLVAIGLKWPRELLPWAQEWTFQLVFPVGFGLMALHFLLRSIESGREAFGNAAPVDTGDDASPDAEGDTTSDDDLEER